jgi:hypothetical protein
LFKPPSLWYFVLPTLAMWHRFVNKELLKAYVLCYRFGVVNKRIHISWSIYGPVGQTETKASANSPSPHLSLSLVANSVEDMNRGWRSTGRRMGRQERARQWVAFIQREHLCLQMRWDMGRIPQGQSRHRWGNESGLSECLKFGLWCWDLVDEGVVAANEAEK